MTTLDPRLATVLRDGVLDRETKLKIIDLLSYGDERIRTEVTNLVLEWSAQDQNTSDLLWKALEAIATTRV